MNHRALFACAVLLWAGCGKQTFLASAFVQTPALPDPVHPGQTIPGYAVLQSYLGTIDTTDPTHLDASKEAPLPGAVATLGWTSLLAKSDVVLAVKDQGDGRYTLDSKAEPRLTLEQGQRYTLVVLTPDGDAFGASVTPGPPAPIVEFQGSRIIDRGAGSTGQDFTITRGDAPGSDGYRPAFVLVGQIDPANPAAAPTQTYSTVPENAAAILKYALSDRPYRVPTFALPGATAFPRAGYYVVALLAAQTGRVSSNAFIGSIAIAGTGDAGIVYIH